MSKRNMLCRCGSGKKYKKCCLQKDQESERLQRTIRRPENEHFTIEVNPEVEEQVSFITDKIEAGDFVTAKNMIDDLLESHPANHQVLFVQGIYAIKTNDKVKAAQCFEKATKIFPPFTEAWLNLGMLHSESCRLHLAVDCFRNITRNSNDSEYVQIAQEQLDRLSAIVKRTTGLSLDSHVEGQRLFDKGCHYLQEKNYKSAITLFQLSIEFQPKCAATHNNLGLAHMFLGNKEEAQHCIDQALQINPDYEPAKINRNMPLNMDDPKSLEMATINQ